MSDYSNLRPLEDNEFIIAPNFFLEDTISVYGKGTKWSIKGFGLELSVKRTVDFQQQSDGSWLVCAYDPKRDDESGGSLEVKDAQLARLVGMIASLIRDPDEFGSRVARMHDGPWTGPVSRKKSKPDAA